MSVWGDEVTYTLVNQHSNRKINHFVSNCQERWWFSMAMLAYQIRTTSIRLIFPGFCAPCCEHSPIKLMIRVRFSRMHRKDAGTWGLPKIQLRNCMMNLKSWRFGVGFLPTSDFWESLTNLVDYSYPNRKNSVFFDGISFQSLEPRWFSGTFEMGKTSGWEWKDWSNWN